MNFDFTYIKSSLKVFTGELLSILYNTNCIICGCSKNVNILCKSCAKRVEFLSPFAHTKIDGVDVFSALIYEGVTRKTIHRLKFQHDKEVAKLLADFLSEYYKKLLEAEFEKSDNKERFKNRVIVPIPTTKRNISQRGYNNVFELAKRFGENENLPILKDFLIKIKTTKPQFELTPKQRKKNVSGSFGININKYSGQKILLFDDIFTTGATVKEAIKVLKENGIQDIICLTLSKTPC